MFGLAWIGILLFGVAAAYLYWHNRTEKATTAILSVLLGASVTAFITISSMMKESSIEKSFLSAVIVETESGRLPFPRGGEASLPMFEWYEGLAHLGRETKIIGDKSVLVDPPVASQEERFARCRRLLHYRLLSVIRDLYGTEQIGNTPGNHLFFRRRRPAPDDMRPIPQAVVATLFNGFPSASGSSEDWNLKHLQFLLPEGTRIDSRDPASGGLPEKIEGEIRIWKPDFFEVTLRIRGGGALHTPSSLPEGLVLLSPPDTKTSAYLYWVDIGARFFRWRAGNERTPQYRAWIEDLIDGIESLAAIPPPSS